MRHFIEWYANTPIWADALGGFLIGYVGALVARRIR